MAEVYGNVEVVISAALLSNGDGGCFSTRSMPSGELTDHHHAVGTTQFSPELRSAFGADGETFKYYVRLNGPHNHFTRTLMKSDLSPLDPLFQRTWAYQERALARRVVHFTKYDLVWECRESQKCECMYLDGGPRGSMRGNGAPLKSAFVNSDFSNMQTHLENNIWHRIVKQYTRTRLTQQLDILPAMSGILKYMQDSGAGSYGAGVWLANFRQDLLWYPIRPGRRPSSYIAPSDVEANGVIPGSAVYCLAVDLAYDEDDREIIYHALVLKELSSRKRTYERIGMLFLVDEQMDDLFYGGAVVDITLV